MLDDESETNRFDDPELIAPGLTEDTLRRHLRQAMESEPSSPHPEPERLLALRANELRSGEEKPLLAHLGACRECSDLLAFFALAEDPEPVAEERLAEAWARLPERLTTSPAVASAQGRRPSPLAALIGTGRRALETLRGLRLHTELVALATLAVVVGLWWHDHARLAALTTPQVNVAVHELGEGTLRGLTRGASSLAEAAAEGPTPGGVKRIELQREEVFFTLALDVEPGHQRYRVRILDADGEVRWSDDRLRVDELGIAVVVLNRHFLSNGRYTVEITTDADDATRWSFPVELVAL